MEVRFSEFERMSGFWNRRIDNRQSIPRMQRMNAIFRINIERKGLN